jgi:predicted NAD-dependent protein-ADP-ribosyltransferase YbiA (DUF1768 family)
MKVAFRMESPTLLETLGFSTPSTQDTDTPSTTNSSSLTPSTVNSSTSTPFTATPFTATPSTPDVVEAETEKAVKTGKRKERRIQIPTDSSSFFRVRAKNLYMFQFTAGGDLQVPEMRGEPAKVIELPYYRPATALEIEQEEQRQFEEIRAVEREFDETFKLLKSAITEWRSTGYSADVIKYQRDLQRLDAQRTQLRSPLRWTKEFKNLSVNKILLSEIHEKRKLGYPVLALKSVRLPYEKTIIASKTKPETGDAESDAGSEGEGEVEAEAEADEVFILFSSPTDPEHGFLSPDTMVEFIYNSTKYNCIFQAYEGERLTMMGRQDVRPILLKSRNPRQMRVITSRVVGQVETPRELLINILKALISQHPNFADDLRKTGTSTLVYSETRDGVLGVGMSATDPQITEKTSWKGKNFLGQAWTAVREGLPPLDQDVEPLQQGGGYTEHGKTLEEEKIQRKNVLMGKYRHRRGFN